MPRFSKDHKLACQTLTLALAPLAQVARYASDQDRALVDMGARVCMLAQQWARSPAEANRRTLFESIKELELKAGAAEGKIARGLSHYAVAARFFGTVQYAAMARVLAHV